MSLCARCGAEFSCGVADGPAAKDDNHAPCWCMTLPALPKEALRDVASAGGKPACLCRECLLAAQRQATSQAGNANKSV